MKWIVLFSAMMFLCLAGVVMAEETTPVDLTSTVMAEETTPVDKFDVRIYNLDGSSDNMFWGRNQNGHETMTDSVKRNAGVRVSGIFRSDDAGKLWVIPIHVQGRVSYQHFSANARMWNTSGFGETGWKDVEFTNRKMTLDSVALQAFVGTDIVRVKNISLRFFVPITPSLALEKTNGQYGLASFLSSFLELKVGRMFVEAGVGWKVSLSGFAKYNQTNDTDKYVGFGYQIL